MQEKKNTVNINQFQEAIEVEKMMLQGSHVFSVKGSLGKKSYENLIKRNDIPVFLEMLNQQVQDYY